MAQTHEEGRPAWNCRAGCSPWAWGRPNETAGRPPHYLLVVAAPENDDFSAMLLLGDTQHLFISFGVEGEFFARERRHRGPGCSKLHDRPRQNHHLTSPAPGGFIAWRAIRRHPAGNLSLQESSASRSKRLSVFLLRPTSKWRAGAWLIALRLPLLSHRAQHSLG